MTIGHNSGGIAGEALRQYVTRIERLREEVKALNADVSDVYKEAKSTGFDPKIIRALVAERAKSEHELAEHNELLELYRAMVNGTDLATRARTEAGE